MLDSRLYNSAGSNATRSQLIHPIIMSIIFEHLKKANGSDPTITPEEGDKMVIDSIYTRIQDKWYYFIRKWNRQIHHKQ